MTPILVTLVVDPAQVLTSDWVPVPAFVWTPAPGSDHVACVGAHLAASPTIRPLVTARDFSPIVSMHDVRRSTISYSDVVVFEVGISASILKLGSRSVVPSVSHSMVPVPVSNLIVIQLDFDVVDEVSTYVEDYSSTIAIFRFRGFWPSLSALHAWISKLW